jgi:hypothetical protein
MPEDEGSQKGEVEEEAKQTSDNSHTQELLKDFDSYLAWFVVNSSKHGGQKHSTKDKEWESHESKFNEQ